MGRRLRLGFNGRFLASKHPTGTHRSAAGFLGALARHPEIDLVLFAPDNCVGGIDAEVKSLLELRIVPCRSKIQLHAWEQLVWPNDRSCDLYFNPLGTGPFIFPAKRHVLVVHDLNAVKLPRNYSLAFRLWQHLACARAARNCPQVLCFTEFVKQDIVNTLNIPESRVNVVPQGPGIKNLQPTGSKRDRRYFLCVGSLQPHKNLPNILAAWKQSKFGDRGFELVVVGKKQDGFKKLPGLRDAIELPGVVFTGAICDQELVDLYSHAESLIYPSFAEGFGLPIVEAYQFGCPVITSNCSCLPEIAGNGALLVDPYSVSSIAEAMHRITEPGVASALAAGAATQSKRFTWESAGFEVYRTLERHVEGLPSVHQ